MLLLLLLLLMLLYSIHSLDQDDAPSSHNLKNNDKNKNETFLTFLKNKLKQQESSVKLEATKKKDIAVILKLIKYLLKNITFCQQ